MIFASKGIIICALSLISFLTLTDRPASARWLSQGENDLAIAGSRSKRVGATEVLDRIDTTKVLRGIFSPVALAIAFILLLNNIVTKSLAFLPPQLLNYLPHSQHRRSATLYCPLYVAGAFVIVPMLSLSWLFGRRIHLFIISAPLMMASYIISSDSTTSSVRYGATFLVAMGAFSFGTLCNAQVAANVVSDTARSAAVSTNVIFGNIGGLISTWLFLPCDSPDYYIGNGHNLATSSTTPTTSILLLLWMTASNKQRAKRHIDGELGGLRPKQIQDLD